MCVKSKLPESLQNILSDEEKRKRLVIFINPPYAEVSSVGSKSKAGVNITAMHSEYTKVLKTAGREIFVQFLIRVYYQISGCILAEFSTLKTLQGPAFENFRNVFLADLKQMFVAPADTFDNVDGQFPIGFKIWDTSKKVKFSSINAEVFDRNGVYLLPKTFQIVEKQRVINAWIKGFKVDHEQSLGFLCGTNGNDFQQQKIVYILNRKEQMANPRGIWINEANLMTCAIYVSVRHCIKATWLNDRDQFLYPQDSWRADSEFHYDCLAFILFHGQNKITCKEGINHFIPFKEGEVGAKERFESDFMVKFIQGKIKPDAEESKADFAHNFFYDQMQNFIPTEPIIWSKEAQSVFDAGRKLWKHYHTQAQDSKNYLINASLYDIKAYFQGFNPKGKMNPPIKAQDEVYRELLGALNYELSLLAKKLESKVYEHGFLEE